MAFEFIGNNSITASAGENELAILNVPRPYAAVFRFVGFDACTVAVEWRARFITDGVLTVWSSGDIAVTGLYAGTMTPVVPLARELGLWFRLISGTPGAAQVEWDMFGL